MRCDETQFENSSRRLAQKAAAAAAARESSSSSRARARFRVRSLLSLFSLSLFNVVS
tara:strand:- start:113 stop:283 length:171 start_codon:yes stop_codon:yes gene_type:complete